MAARLNIKIDAVYGNWKVLELVLKPTKYAKYEFLAKRYKVQCQLCNISVSVMSASVIINQKIKQCRQCGFKNRFQYNNKDIGQISLGYFNRIKRDAFTRNFKFKISQQYIWDLFCSQIGECALTGKSIQMATSWRSHDQTASLDRIDSREGYIEGNVQWVHRDINQMKWNLSQEDFIEKCIEVVNYKEQCFNKYYRTKPL